MKFGDKIRVLRENKNISREELSTTLNIKYSTLSNYENNIRQPDFEITSKLADYFNVSVDYLLGRTDDPCVYYKVLQENKDIPVYKLKFDSPEELFNALEKLPHGLREEVVANFQNIIKMIDKRVEEEEKEKRKKT